MNNRDNNLKKYKLSVPCRFEGLTIVILASNEQESLRKTIRVIIEKCDPNDVKKIIVFLKSADCPAAEELQMLLKNESFSVPIYAYVQKGKRLPEAYAEIPPLVNSSHFLMMFSDFATSPASVSIMIEKAKLYPDAIVCASKFHKDSVLQGYGFCRKLSSVLLNRVIARLVRSDGTELYSIFQVYPKALVDEMELYDPRTFVYEYTIKPVAKGVRYIEVPTVFSQRVEGESNYRLYDEIRTAITLLRTGWNYRVK